ncbi:serine/threonine protein kinase [Plesiocystis pacifica SIR-1]|uniref:Serine/threonine protein kinase n=2 Tax=Plesiocystis pacifica TaxID=191768 RepID=A6G6N4_9BACT|nr:serine/threonine protein kinase [Plesiocystis pacifica SIR-1]
MLRAQLEAPARIGRFEVARLLGRGGMGAVYVGVDGDLDREVALKLLRPGSTSARGRHRLLREAQALAKLSHPNVVQVHEVGEERGAIYIAMELVEGQTLSDWALSSADWRGRLEVLLQAGRGLGAAHAAGLVHRDFKPDNVLVGADGRARVLDFGLVRRLPGADPSLDVTQPEGGRRASQERETLDGELSDSALTMRGTVMGTPAYMAPEQHAGRPCDTAADQYAFCVTALEILHGQRPFAAGTMRALAAAKDARELRPAPRERALPRSVQAALVRGLEPEPGARWPSMEALLDVLEASLGPSKLRPWSLVAGTFAVLGVALGLASARPRGAVAAPACALGARSLEGFWDGERAAGLDAKLGADAGAVRRRLDAWAGAWVLERRASCQATHVEGTQSAAMLDRREACLLRQRAEFDAVLEVLEEFEVGPALAPGAAVSALDALPERSACSVAALDASASARRSETDEAAFAELARARAELNVGSVERGRQRVLAVAERAEADGQVELSLEARRVLATLADQAGSLDEALEILREATHGARRAGLSDLEASVRVQRARVAAGDSGHPALEAALVDEAQLALEGVGRPEDPRAVTLEIARARVAEQAGDWDAAIAAHERAHALAEGRLDETSRALVRVGVGTARYRAGDYAGAQRELEACVDAVTEGWGPRAPQLARVHFNLAMVASDLGQQGRAREHMDAALALDRALWGEGSLELARDRFASAYLDFGAGEMVRGCAEVDAIVPTYEAELGPEHDETGQLLTAAGMCRFFEDRLEDAEASYERALTIQRQRLGEDHYEVGLLHSNLAEVALARGEFELAGQGYDRAAEIFAGAVPEDHPLHAYALRGQGAVWLEQGEADRAVVALERALAIADASNAVEFAEIQLALARARVAVGRPNELAEALAEQALQTFTEAGAMSRAEAARAWLER